MINPNNPNSSASDQAGSGNGPANGGAGQPGNVNYEEMYNELQKKLGEQGKELGDYRSFFEKVSPALGVLDSNPELYEAVSSGAINDEIALAIKEGRVTISDVKLAEKAYADIEKSLGKKGVEKASVEDLKTLVEAKVGELKKEVTETLRENEELRSFQNNVNDFVDRTPDFPQYAEEIEKWLEKHPDINDMEVAYFAVKGQLSGKDAEQRAEEEKAEYAKNMALNAGGGGSRSNFIDASDGDVIDSLIAPRSNPNVF